MNQTLRKTIAAGLTVVTLAVIPLTVNAAQVTDFKDIKSSAWYYAAVDYAAREGLFSGTSKTTFSPEQAMTRGMFVTVLGNQAGISNEKKSRPRFSDVNPSEYYAPFVEWAASNGIVSGTGNGKFSPNESVTREQMAVILYRYVQSISGDTTFNNTALNKFPDAHKVSGFAIQAMQWAVTHGVLSGSDGKLMPQGTATRAQVAQVFMNARDLLVKEEIKPEPTEEPTERPQLVLHSNSWKADQNPYEILEQVLAGSNAKWDSSLNAGNAYREIVIDFVDWGDSHKTADWAIFNTLELLNNTGADRFYILEEMLNGAPAEMLTLYYTIPEKVDSALMAEVKKLVQKEFPKATFKIMGGGHGWRGFTQADSNLTLAQNAQRIAATEIRYLKEWYKAGDTFTYWISEPEPGVFYHFY